MHNRPMQTALVRIATVASLLAFLVSTGECAELRVGAARIDSTPDTPIRLSGYSARTTESTGVEDPLFVRALAIGEDREHAVVVVTADAILLPGALCDEIARMVFERTKLPRQRIVFCATHNHSAPCLENALGNLFATPLPADQLERIAQYTTKLKAVTTQAILAALDAMQPATLAFGRGSVGFAANRRTPGGPVDHDLPLLVARDPLGQPLATLVAYACHCTTHGLTQNRCAAEWAGHANLLLEAAHPGLVALTAIGCGADSGPKPTGDGAVAKQHGNAIAQEVERLLASSLRFISAEPTATLETIALPFATLPSRAELEARLAKGGHVANHARHFLDLPAIPTELPYRIQTLRFGVELAMTFLAGEVVVDYAKRLKREIDPERLFLAAYSNDCPCYIPSRRILEEGGYEAATAMTYYLQPTKLSSATEDLIVREVRRQVGSTYLTAESLAEFPLPTTPEQALAEFELADPNLSIALVASEPLIESPVWLEFGLFGELYVVEQRDFPNGLHGGGEPGGRVKRLIDIDHDGDYDEATLFLDGLEMPKQCIAHDGGLYVLTAKNVVFGQDLDGDGVAESRVAIAMPLDQENRGARVESLGLVRDAWGGLPAGQVLGEFIMPTTREGIANRRKGSVDGWSNPVFVAPQFQSNYERMGKPKSVLSLTRGTVRYRALAALRTPLARNDFGDWFAWDASEGLVNLPLRERDLALTPTLRHPPLLAPVSLQDGDGNRVSPSHAPVPAPPEFVPTDRITSARGLEIYRDSWLGAEYDNNAFVCVPTHNVVVRRILEPKASSYVASRAETESSREFLSSQDPWFRPMQVRTGPDGALYVVDMARFLIESQLRLPPERIASLDLRAGEQRGRVWRIERRGSERRPVPDLVQLDPVELANALDSPNGTLRDLVHEMLAHWVRVEDGRIPRKIGSALEQLIFCAEHPAAAAHAIDCLLEFRWYGAVIPDQSFEQRLIELLTVSRDSRIRAHALCALQDVRRSEKASIGAMKGVLEFGRLALPGSFGPLQDHTEDFSSAPIEAKRITWALANFAQRIDEDLPVTAPATLLKFARIRDPYSRAAFLGFASREFVVPGVAASNSSDPDYQELLRGLCDVAAARDDQRGTAELVRVVAKLLAAAPDDQRVVSTATRLRSITTSDPKVVDSIVDIGVRLREIAKNERAKPELRAAVVDRLGVANGLLESDIDLLARWLALSSARVLQTAALERLAAIDANASRQALISAVSQAAPNLRRNILERLTESGWAASSLLNAISVGRVAPQFLDAELRDRMFHHADDSVATLAVVVLGKPRLPADELKAAQTANSLTGDRTRGEAVFDRSCASCHSYRGRGHDVGGELAFVGDRSLGRLLPAILDPNAKFDPAYEAYEIVTRNERTRVGRVEGSTSISVLLELPGGTKETILRSDIQSQRATGRSLMPEGFGIDLTPQDLADLGACLNSK